jgi:L-fuculose-phosphate aldolase
MGDRRTFLIQQIVKYANKLDAKGFGANHDGNISAKFEDILLATPTAVSKGNIVTDMIIELDNNGKKIAGNGKPFSEIKQHLAAYHARSDVKAVVHAHPPFATARGLVGAPLRPAIPEAIVSIGDVIPVVRFAMPGSEEHDEIITEVLTQTDVFMMPGNGVFATGVDVEQAYLRLELVEHVAKIQYHARVMGAPMKLAQEDVATLLAKRAAIGLGPQQNSSANPTVDVIKKLITEELKELL